MRRPDLAALLIAGGLALPAPAMAQALSCAITGNVPQPRAAGPSASEPVRRLPVAANTLALSWSPEYCRDKQGDGSFQCDGSARFGFVLHGLWPDGAGSQWPQFCAPASLLPAPVVKAMLCTTPSADLLQHEWAKHGTCGWTDPTVYFARSRGLYEKLRFPDMIGLSRRRDLTVGEFRTAMVRANSRISGLTAASIRVRTKNGWLSELWLCLDRKFAYARCKAGQGGGDRPDQQLKIWRGRLNDR